MPSEPPPREAQSSGRRADRGAPGLEPDVVGIEPSIPKQGASLTEGFRSKGDSNHEQGCTGHYSHAEDNKRLDSHFNLY